ncbi:tetratricopeptide repeat protein [Candidatus Odyssella thessalonicensis]|uniref:tetratricopeptide repeat protein n=1 Tax=Candidatus Odyssella thessalonicensis TaxID=84647 RepID=UPI000225B760|nr:SEL1-like repeat protein [Candidatus Odyssella thessalonicensis]
MGTKAAEQGVSEAQFNLGQMYKEGRAKLFKGKISDKQAVYWYKTAPTKGHAAAQNNLGWMHMQGRVELSKGPGADKMALKCYAKAAIKGHVKAQYGLAIHGKGDIAE